jgi:hypothetical protein
MKGGARTMVRRRWRIAGIAVIAAALAAGAACTRKGDVHVKVVCENVPGAKPIERLTVFVGGSKSSWPVVVPGDSVSVVLPPEGEPPQVSAIYSIGGSRKEWRGPAMDAGAGHLVELRISADGRVVERHCSRPCDLQ